MPLSATPKKRNWTPTSPPTLSLPPPHLFANFSYAAYIAAYNATSHLTSPTPLSSMSAYYADDLAYVSTALPHSGAGASAVGVGGAANDNDDGDGEAAEPSMTITPLSTVLHLFGAVRAAALREKLVPRVVTWSPDGRFILAELDAVFMFGEPSDRCRPKRQADVDVDDDKFPTDGGPLHGVELRRGKPVAVRFWATYEMQGAKIKVLRLARWGAGQVCAWPED